MNTFLVCKRHYTDKHHFGSRRQKLLFVFASIDFGSLWFFEFSALSSFVGGGLLIEIRCARAVSIAAIRASEIGDACAGRLQLVKIKSESS